MDRETRSDFGAFWRGLIGDVALSAARPLAITLTPARVAPGQNVIAEVALRHARTGDVVSMEGTLGAISGATRMVTSRSLRF